MKIAGRKDILVIGAGAGGLSAAYQVSRAGLAKVTLLEKEQDIAGVCRTFVWDEFMADFGPHKIFSLFPEVMGEVVSLFKEEELIKHKKRNRLFLLGNYLDYPISLGNMVKVIGPFNSAAMALSLINTKLRRMLKRSKEDSYEDYIIGRFGDRLYQMVFKPLAFKVWGDPKSLSADIAKTRIPASNAVDVLLRALGLKKEKPETNAEFFYYPKKGFGQIAEKLRLGILESEGRIETGISDLKLSVENDRITGASWMKEGRLEMMNPDLVISAFGLKSLVDSIGGIDLRQARSLVNSLALRHTLLVYLAFDQKKILDDHWIFIPDKDIIFSRVYEPKMLSPGLAPDNKTVICCDLTASGQEAAWKLSDEELAEECREGLVKMRLISDSQKPAKFKVLRVRDFYPRYEIGYRGKLGGIIQELNTISNLICTGRLGMYNYNNLDHCMHMGMIIKQELSKGAAAADINNILLAASLDYRIVD